jgi:flagellar biosynthesis protein FliR
MAFLTALQSVLAGAGVRIDVQHDLPLFLLVLARLVATVTLIPFIGGPSVPGQVRMGFAAIFSFVLFFGDAAIRAAPAPDSPLVWFALLLKEILIGALIGVVAQFVFYGVQTAGTIIDTQRGLNQITWLAPQLPGHVSALGNLQFQAALVLFVSMNGHLLFVRALAGSYRTLPITAFPPVHDGIPALADLTIRISAGMLVTACLLAAPVVLALFLADVAFASMGKIAARIRIADDAHTAKSLIGVALTFFAAAFLVGQLQGIFVRLLASLHILLRALA